MDDVAFQEAYTKLNTEQKRAVDSFEGPVMVVAGPGTGKTTILTLRIANILRKTDVGPENILALTFTNSGVHAMRKKLLSVIGDAAYRVHIFTFHSFAEHIIKEFPSYFPVLEYAKVITAIEKVQLLEEILKEGRFTHIVSSHDPLSSLLSVKRAIDDIKKDGLSPEDFRLRIPQWKEKMLSEESVYYKRKTGAYNVGDAKPAELEKIESRVAKAEEIADVFEMYQEKLGERNRYDFSDMVLTVLRELETNENLKLDVEEQYQYIHVDEHQDTNDGQNRLIELITDAEHLGGHPNVFTVGDEKQSIYRFQGASAEAFTRFKNIFRDVVVVTLTDNYRSTKSILESSHSLITHTMRDAAPLTPAMTADRPIEIYEFQNYTYELMYVAKEIKKLIEGGVSASEIAVIYRSNKHIDEVQQLFSAEHIPYTVHSKDAVLDDAHIANLITFAKVIHDPRDNHALGQSLFIDFLGIDPLVAVGTLAAFRNASKGEGVALIDVLADSPAYQGYLQCIKSLKTRSQNTSFEVFFKELMQESGYLEHVLTLPDSRDHLQKAHTLTDEIKRQSDQNKHYSLGDFVAFVDAARAYGIDIESTHGMAEDGVQCMTAHKSKGLEFEYVFMVNTTRKAWEKNRGGPALALPIDNFKGELDDERRLFYVAMTRAKKHLFISSSKHDWEGVEHEPSQFISEIDDVYRTRVDTADLESALYSSSSQFLVHTTPERDVFDTAYLTKLFFERNLSVSALNNYIHCSLKYFFKNLILLPDVYTPFLVYGNAVHTALEEYFNASKDAKMVLDRDMLIAYFKKAMARSVLFDGEYERYTERGVIALGMYHDVYHEIWSTNLATELYIKRRYPLNDGDELTISGKLDKVEFLESEAGGNVRVIDYKTGKAYSEKKRKEQKADLERQVVFYHLLLDTYKDGAYRVVETVLDFVEKTKKGTFEQKTFAVQDTDKKRVNEEIEALAHDVKTGALLKKGCGKRGCEWCALYKRLRV